MRKVSVLTITSLWLLTTCVYLRIYANFAYQKTGCLRYAYRPYAIKSLLKDLIFAHYVLALCMKYSKQSTLGYCVPKGGGGSPQSYKEKERKHR